MKQDNFKKGRWGENRAMEMLAAKGYELIEKNYKNKIGEIDLIVKSRGVLVFVEVKTKWMEEFGQPEEMLTKSKIKQVKRTAELFIRENKPKLNSCTNYRVDGICLTIDRQGQTTRISHYENISQ